MAMATAIRAVMIKDRVIMISDGDGDDDID